MAVVRDAKGRIVKGSGALNPGGRKRAKRTLVSACKELTMDALGVVKEVMYDEEGKASDRLKAATLVLHYGNGMPVKAMDVSAEVSHRVDPGQSYLQAMKKLARAGREKRQEQIREASAKVIDLQPVDTTHADGEKLAYAKRHK